MSEADGLVKLTQFLNQTKRQAEMAIDCLNQKIAELEEKNLETEKVAEKYMDERDYYKNFAEQLQLENSKKWRLQERDDWKALVDSVQRDRGRLQEECNIMERELAEALERIDELESTLSSHEVPEMTRQLSDDSSGIFTFSPGKPTSKSPLRASFIAVGDTEEGDQGGVVDTNGDVNQAEGDISVTSIERDVSTASTRSELLDGLYIDIPQTESSAPSSPPRAHRQTPTTPGGRAKGNSESDTPVSESKGQSSAFPSPSPSPRDVRGNTSSSTPVMDASPASVECPIDTRISRSASLDVSTHSSATPTPTVRDLRLELANVIAELEIVKRSAEAEKYEKEEEILHLEELIADISTKLQSCPSCGYNLSDYISSLRNGEHVETTATTAVVVRAPAPAEGLQKVPSSSKAVVQVTSGWSAFSLFGFLFSSSSSGTAIDNKYTSVQRV